MENEILTYADKIGRALLDLPEGGEFLIERKVALENLARFISIVKSYIDRNLGKEEQPKFYICISSDYKRIKKFPIERTFDSEMEREYILAIEKQY